MSNIYNSTAQQNGKLTQLSGSKTTFRKQLIRFGDWIDPTFPEDIMRIDRVFLENLLKNYKNGVPGRIPVPLTHTDNPEYNTGELVDLYIEGDGAQLSDGLYGVLEIRRDETAEDIKNELIWDVSISFTDNYQDNQNGALYGPTLLHVALVNNPYIKKMNPFTALAESLKNTFKGAQVHMLSESAKENKMRKIKNDREFSVELSYKNGEAEEKVTLAPGQELELSDEHVEAVEKQLADAVAPETEDEKKAREAKETEDKQAEADAEAKRVADEAFQKEEEEKNLSESDKTKRELAEVKAKLLDKDIDETYQKALSDGKIVPAQEESFKALSIAMNGHTRNLSDGKTQNLSELLAEFVEKAPKVVSLNEENGKNGDDSKGPIAKLSEPERKGLQALQVSDEDYVKYGGKESMSINDLKEVKE